MTRLRTLVLATASGWLVAACGGGGSDSPAPTALVAVTPVSPTITPGTLVTSVPAFTGGDADKIAAYTKLNAVRGTCGFGLLAQNAQLEVSAQNHANYIEANFVTHADAFGHVETAAYTGFTGAQPHDRNLFAGYGDSSQSEDLVGVSGTTSTPQVDGVTALLAFGYHLKYLAGQGAYDIGIAAKQVPLGGVTVVELGSQQAVLQDISSAELATYPCAGLTVKTSTVGIGRESPDPFPARDYSARPLGAPIYARVRNGQTLAVTSFAVVSAAGVPVVQAALFSQATDPNRILGANEVLFYPDVPLAVGVTYTVTITGTNNGTPFTRSFTFNTN